MKHLFLFFTLLFCLQITAQRKPKIKGSRIVTDVQENLPPFNTIELKDDLEIKLLKSPQEGYTITADDNLVDVLKFSVEDSVLTISSFYNITSKKKLDIAINYTDLNAIRVLDGDIRMDGAIITDELDVHMFESAKIQLNAEATIMAVHMEGNSSGDFTLKGDEINFILKDRADVNAFAVSEKSILKMYKNASAELEGTSSELTINLLENSNLKSKGLESETVFANLQGSSSAQINVITTLELTSSGSSKTYLHGSGKIEIIEFLDTSELHKED